MVKVLGIEVHFGLLAARGKADAPEQIESLLGMAGFSCTWTDSSHLLAVKAE